MRIINKLIVPFLVLILAFGCTKDFEKININPNQPSDPNPAYLLTNAQKQLMDNVWDEWFNGRFGMLYSQYWSQTSYTDESRYQIRDNNTDTYWRNYYTAMMDLQEIIKLNTGEDTKDDMAAFGHNDNQIALARIMKAWMIQIVTDIWGDVPYSEAHKGAEIPSPAYDTQADIYAGLLSELTAAQSQINVGGLGVSGDQVYGGDMALWKMCANSLKMRVAMRMSGVNSGTALTAIQEALSAGVFESNADNAQLVYATGEDGGNPLWVNRYIANRQDFSISEPFVNMLLARNDPRIDFFSDTPANDPGNHKGFPYGLSNTNATPLSIYDHSMMSDQNVMHVSAPGMIMNYAEVLFIKAEAVQALGLSGQGTAQEAYEAAVTASCEMWGASADAAATYLTETGVAWTAGSEPQLIGEQKYIALYMQGLQGWSEWRRTGWPVLEGPVDGSLIDMTGTIIPTRRTYPDQEELLNGANYDAAVARQGADLMDTKLWWDVD